MIEQLLKLVFYLIYLEDWSLIDSENFQIILAISPQMNTGRSIEDALLELVQSIKETLYRKLHCCSLFLDIQKAFDKIFIEKIHSAGVKGNMVD